MRSTCSILTEDDIDLVVDEICHLLRNVIENKDQDWPFVEGRCTFHSRCSVDAEKGLCNTTTMFRNAQGLTGHLKSKSFLKKMGKFHDEKFVHNWEMLMVGKTHWHYFIMSMCMENMLMSSCHHLTSL